MEFGFKPLEHKSGEAFVFGPLQTKWLEALESGKFEQGRHLLKNLANQYCCLGVLCEVANVPFIVGKPMPDGKPHTGFQDGDEIECAYTPAALSSEIGFHGRAGELVERRSFPPVARLNALTAINDSSALSFKQIAEYIRYDPWNVFSKSA